MHGRDVVEVVESLWDGDAQGWFVELVAIVQRPSRQVRGCQRIIALPVIFPLFRGLRGAL